MDLIRRWHFHRLTHAVFNFIWMKKVPYSILLLYYLLFPFLNFSVSNLFALKQSLKIFLFILLWTLVILTSFIFVLIFIIIIIIIIISIILIKSFSLICDFWLKCASLQLFLLLLRTTNCYLLLNPLLLVEQPLMSRLTSLLASIHIIIKALAIILYILLIISHSSLCIRSEGAVLYLLRLLV